MAVLGLTIGSQELASGMTYLHSRKPSIIHKDLKSPNILVSSSGVKICDFDLAERVKRKSTMTMREILAKVREKEREADSNEDGSGRDSPQRRVTAEPNSGKKRLSIWRRKTDGRKPSLVPQKGVKGKRLESQQKKKRENVNTEIAYFPGTIRWAAPEILSNDGRNHSFKSDVYSFGVVAFEVLATAYEHTYVLPFQEVSGGGFDYKVRALICFFLLFCLSVGFR